jgi:peptide/nickel transport system permease protein
LRSQGDKAALEKVDFLRKQYGLDKPFIEQYAVWVGIWPAERGFSGLLQGDWGWSFEHDLPVSEVIGDRMLLSFILNFTVVLFTWAGRIPDRRLRRHAPVQLGRPRPHAVRLRRPRDAELPVLRSC